MCTRTEHPPKRTHTMTLPAFKELLVQLKKLPVKTFVGHNLGEPLLTPQYMDMLELFDSMYTGRTFIMNTNASKLTRNITSRLLMLHNNRYEINLSLDAVRSATYRLIHGKPYAPVKKNVLSFLKQYREHPNRNMTIVLNFTVSPANISEQKMFLDFWKPFIARSSGIKIRCNPLAWTRTLQKQFNYTVWTRVHPDAGILRLQNPRHRACFKPWNMLSVRANGDVSICCYSTAPGLVIGNYRTRSIPQLLTGARMNALRRAFLHKDHTYHPFCYFCHG